MAKPTVFRVALLGGGTGGHIYPLVAVKQSLQKFTAEKEIALDARYFGDPGQYQFYLEKSGIRIQKIASSKLRRYFSFLNFLDIFRFFFGFWQALWKLFWFMPDVVFSKGGPGVVPIIFAASFYRIPIVVHESDAVPGMANRISAKRAELIQISFPEALPYFADIAGGKEIRVVGTPVRESLFTEETHASARLSFGLLDEQVTVVVMGGSQGAQTINEFVLQNSEALLKRFELIHQVGPRNFGQYQAEFNFMSKNYPVDIKKNYLMFPFLDDNKMALALAAADVVISRAGASSINDIAAAGKPAILVPLPDSANNHQRENAYAYAKTGAAVVIEEENLLPNLVIAQLEKIMTNKAVYERMSAAAHAFYKPSVADAIAHDLVAVSRIMGYAALTQEQ